MRLDVLKWDQHLAMGVAELDDGHRELVDLYNRIAWACEHEPAVPGVRERIRSFLMYARWHFFEEEGYMYRHHYPDYVDHKADHERLLQDAEDFVENLGSSFTPQDIAAIVHYFKYWLTRHTARKDQQFGAFLASCTIAEPESLGDSEIATARLRS